MLATLAATILAAPLAQAQEPPAAAPQSQPQPPSPGPDAGESRTSALFADVKAYYTAPLHWDAGDWAWFGGSLVAIGASHHFDTQVRTHFVKKQGPGEISKDLQDAVPTVLVLGGTWAYASLIDDSAGRTEAWMMAEAAGLSGVTAFALKFAAARERPFETSDPNAWRKGGDSFPSLHSTAAFAVGTVLAESGNDDYRWIRRLLGYGLGAATSYERLKHNAHWLSDTVAGAALGIASARFAMHRNDRRLSEYGFAVVPIDGGAMLTYHLMLP